MSEQELDEELKKTVAPGTVLVGKYRVERVLGTGGMGVVVAATHLELEELVAVKFLQTAALKNEEAAARFVREAKAAVKIKSEHVARVIDVGRLENGAPYMVMEYLSGHDLSNAPRPIAIEDVVDYVIQACDAMAEAHAAGIVHRDLKPANLFLIQRSDGSPLVKVLDFGISKLSVPDMSEASLTRTSTAMGSPYYMSPEQMRNAKRVDHRTDVWSLGTILFELFGAKTPFTGGSLPELCAAILSDQPRPLRELRPEVSPELEQIVLRCLEKDAKDRYQNVAELALALAPFAPRRSKPIVERVVKVLSRAGMGESLTPPPASEARPEAKTNVIGPKSASGTEAARTNAAWSDTALGERARKSPALALGLAAVGFFAAVGIGWALSKSGGSAAPEPAPSAAAQPTVAATPAPLPVAPAVPEPTVAVAPALSSAPPPASAAPATTATKKVEAKPKSEPAKAEPPKEAPKPEPAKPPPPPKPKNPLDIGLK